MSYKTIVFFIIIIWGLPAMQLRSQFRKMIYNTNDWKINIKPVFVKEFKALFSNASITDPKEVRIRNRYRFYLLVYLALIIWYKMIP
jgi:peroxiredoxin Q/BCP